LSQNRPRPLDFVEHFRSLSAQSRSLLLAGARSLDFGTRTKSHLLLPRFLGFAQGGSESRTLTLEFGDQRFATGP
jgi:hypothetical protein